MYGIDGRKDLTESTLDHLSGYVDSRPVRIGNGAFDQHQNDVFGALLDSVYIHTKAREHVPTELWEVVADQVERRDRVWQQPRPGDLGGARRAQALRLLEADVLGRARPWHPAGAGAPRARTWPTSWGRGRRARSREDILANGVSERGVFRQHYETDALDASTLLIPLVRFLPRRRRARPQHGAGDRRRADQQRARPALHDRRDRRRPARGGGHVLDLLVLARLGALGDRRDRPGAGADRPAAADGRRARPVRRGDRAALAASSSATTRRPSPTSP